MASGRLFAAAQASVVDLEVETERKRWRESVLNGVFLSSALGGAFIALLLLQQGVAHRSVGAAAVAGVATACIVFANRLGFVVRAVLLMSTIYGACGVGLVIDGFTSESLLGLAFMIALGTLLMGRTVGIAATAACVATILVIGLLHSSDWLSRPNEWWSLMDTGNPETVSRVTVVFTVVSGALVIGISHLIGRAETLLQEKTQSLQALRDAEAERERIRKHLDQHERELRRARELEALGRLAGFAAHDFNNTLYVISGNTEIAMRSLQDPSLLEGALRAIEAATRDATATSKQLLAFGAHGAHRTASLNPKEEAQRAAPLLQRILSSQIKVRLETQASTPSIRAEEGALQRILLNLALNARDAMPDGGTLSIKVWDVPACTVAEPVVPHVERYVAIAVEDDGCGMDDGTVQQLFEPFFTTKGKGGTGLGLSSVHSLVREAGGHIEVESAVDQGTRFTIYWPAEEHRPHAVAMPATNLASTPSDLM